MDWNCSITGGGQILPVVILADLSHRDQGFEVLVRLVGVDVVERAAVARITIRGSEINSYLGRQVAIKEELHANYLEQHPLSDTYAIPRFTLMLVPFCGLTLSLYGH